MKDNVLILKNSSGVRCEYRILLDIKNTNNNINYVIYTNDEIDDNGDYLCYVSSYVLSEKGNMTKLKPVDTKEEYDFISQILNSLESGK